MNENALNNILDFIPQRPPMVMIDCIIESEDKTIVSKFFIKEDNIFCGNGKFKEAGLIENIAQTAAAGIGLKFFSDNSDIKKGFIGAIKNFKLFFLPDSNDEIITKVDIVNEIFNTLIIFGKIEQNNKIAAECEMKIFLKED